MNRFVIGIGFAVLFTSAAVAQPNAKLGFVEYVTERANRQARPNSSSSDKQAISNVCPIDSSIVARRVFAEYGAVFAATEKVVVPPVCIFEDEAAVSKFRSTMRIQMITLRGVNVLLQQDAAEALMRMLDDAAAQGIIVTPLDGSIAGGRTYYETLRIWNSRFEPALEYWTRRGMISTEDAAAVRSMKIEKQVEKIIEWEMKGYRFGTGRNGSIFSSTAPPGTSQHLSLLALDIAPPVTSDKRALLNTYGWYQTVKGDPGHFTYLGLKESELPSRGLRAVYFDDSMYWVPDFDYSPATLQPN